MAINLFMTQIIKHGKQNRNKLFEQNWEMFILLVLMKSKIK